MKPRGLEARIPPPVSFLFTGFVMWAVNKQMPGVPLPEPWRTAAATLFALAGLVTGASAVFAFSRAKTTIDPVRVERASSLVTTGIYSVTRNPMYVAFTVALIVWALMLSVPWSFMGPIAFSLYINRFQILPEERAMSAKFGRAYENYKEKVRRWL